MTANLSLLSPGSGPQSPQDIKRQVVRLSELALDISDRGTCGEPAECSNPAISRYMGPLAVLAAEGDAIAADRYADRILQLAEARWGVGSQGTGQYLNDTFCLRSVSESLLGLIDSGVIDAGLLDQAGPWLYEFARIRCDGELSRRSDFLQWQLRNQNVPATAVYNIAHLLDQAAPGQYDTQPLWDWADQQIVGWDLSWRTPDDSWLYQFIWVWSAYRHAMLRQPELLQSENARKSTEFYTRLSAPGGVGLVFGDCRPGDLLGPAVALLLGADLFDDGVHLWVAREMIQEASRRGPSISLVDRGPEMFRLYNLADVDHRIQAQPPHRQPELITSPLAGRGWSTGGRPYNDAIKQDNPAFPCSGENTHSWDAIYQIRDPQAYAQEKPDKLLFCNDNDPQSLFALADLRAQGLHDHPDALNLCTLLCDGLPWLVETTYIPATFNVTRWLHNVPLVRDGRHDADSLRTWESDTWREPGIDDVWLQQGRQHTLAAARLPADAFDYVPFASNAFDIERFFLFQPDQRLIVIDRLVAKRSAVATVGQAWHTPADVELHDDKVTLTQLDRRLVMSHAQSVAMPWSITSHEACEYDGFYFRQDRRVQDLLASAVVEVEQGNTIVMATCFDRYPADLAVTHHRDRTTVRVGSMAIQIDGFNDVNIRLDRPKASRSPTSQWKVEAASNTSPM